MQVIAPAAMKYGKNYVLNKALGKDARKYKKRKSLGKDDPYFDEVEVRGKRQKRLKQIPDYIPQHDAEILESVKKWAYFMDCKGRFGVGALIGLVPFLGDFADTFFALLIYNKMTKVDGGLPRRMHISFLRRILIDLVIGFTPFLGDILDAVYRCNARNTRKFEKYLMKKYGPKGANKEELNRARLGSLPWDEEEATEQKSDRERSDNQNAPPATGRFDPPPEETRQSRGSWISRWFPQTQQQSDVEMGQVPARSGKAGQQTGQTSAQG